MPEITSVAVFCGASLGYSPAFQEAAAALGRGIARAGWRLVYGGGNLGLMGVVADGALAAGGDVVGVIPEFLRRREVAHAGVANMVITDSMHTRKTAMFERADAFVTLPGGLGTLDETAAALGVQGPALVIIGAVVGQAHAAVLGGRDTSQPPVALT